MVRAAKQIFPASRRFAPAGLLLVVMLAISMAGWGERAVKRGPARRPDRVFETLPRPTGTPVSQGQATASAAWRLARPVVPAKLLQTYDQLPLSFEVNRGQANSSVQFQARGRDYNIFLTDDGVVLTMKSSAPASRATGKTSGLQAPDSAVDSIISSALFPFLGAALAPLRYGQISNTFLTDFDSASSTETLCIRMLRADPSVRAAGLEEMPGRSNYFLGKDPGQWQTGIPNFAKVAYRSIYPGVDLVFYGTPHELEYDFVVAPGSDPGTIRLGIEAASSRPGASGEKPLGLRIDGRGDLVAKTEGGEIRFHRPLVYQPNDIRDVAYAYGRSGKVSVGASLSRTILDGRYILHASGIPSPHSQSANATIEVGFKIGPYDRTKPLIIDPQVSYSTYLGGSQVDAGVRVAVDSSGAAYITGATISPNFPATAGAAQSALRPGTCSLRFRSFNCPDAFVTKMDPSGSSVLYSTYLGGGRGDAGLGIAVDTGGSAYVIGFTSSPDFPTTPGAFQTVQAGQGEAFVSKLNPSGSALTYSTYLGGSKDDIGTGIAVGSTGNAFLTGATSSVDFPTASPFRSANGGGSSCALPSSSHSVFCYDAFVTELNSSGSNLIYSSYFGGSADDGAVNIALDSSGAAYITGSTISSDLPTLNPAQASIGGGTCKYGPPGGASFSASCPDGFAAKINPAGSALVYSTYLGGSGLDTGMSVAVDSLTSAYVVGTTNSSDFPITAGAFQTAFGAGLCSNPESPLRTAACPDAFVAKLSPAGSSFAYATYLGGSNAEMGTGIAVDASGNAYVVGGTNSTNFPTGNAIQPSFGGGSCGSPSVSFTCPNAFLTELSPDGVDLASSTYYGGAGGDIAFGVAFDASGGAFLTGITRSADFPTLNAFQATQAGPANAFVVKASFQDFGLSTTSATSQTIKAGQTATFTVTVSPSFGFNQAVMFACTGAPSQSKCDVNPPSVTPSGSNATVTVTLSTEAGSTAPPMTLPGPTPINFPAKPLLWVLVLIAVIWVTARRRPKPGLALMLAAILTWPACGGSSVTHQQPTPPGTYPLTLTATSGGLSHSTTLTVTVQ